MYTIIPSIAVDVVGLCVSVVFVWNYWHAYSDVLIKTDQLKRPEIGKPWWKSKVKKYDEARWSRFKSSIYWSVLISWSIAATSHIGNVDAPPTIQNLVMNESGVLMVITFCLLMLPVLIILTGVDKLRLIAVIINWVLLIFIAAWLVYAIIFPLMDYWLSLTCVEGCP